MKKIIDDLQKTLEELSVIADNSLIGSNQRAALQNQCIALKRNIQRLKYRDNSPLWEWPKGDIKASNYGPLRTRKSFGVKNDHLVELNMDDHSFWICDGHWDSGINLSARYARTMHHQLGELLNEQETKQASREEFNRTKRAAKKAQSTIDRFNAKR